MEEQKSKPKLSILDKYLRKHYAVYYKKKLALYLSLYLAEKQNLDIDDLKKIRKIHIKRLKLFDKIESENNVAKLHKFANDLEKIEYELQDAWKMDANPDFHSWWFMAPKCTCPKLDNEDRIGTCERIINKNCLMHGDLPV